MPLSKRTIPFRIKNTISLYKFIRKNNIHIVCAHSRASAWVSNLACRFANVPLIVFIHGRQATFLSRRIFHGFGFYTIAICEKLADQLINVFNVNEEKIEVMRNGFDLPLIRERKSAQKTIAFITRLSGPKKDLAYKLLEFISADKDNTFLEGVKFKIIGGQTIPTEFEKFKAKFEFTGYVDNLPEEIDNADLIIGSGRVAIEAALHKKPLIAMGEACTIGLVTKENLQFALETNFGDMNVNEKEFDFGKIVNDIKIGLRLSIIDEEVYERVALECNIENITDRLETIFQSVRVRFYKNEIPIIYYHRIAKNLEDAGKHGIYVTAEQFEKHLKYLRDNNFKTVSFDEALRIKKYGTPGNYVIITFDDGYEDNYTLAFPLLKKYGFKAMIFLVSNLKSNKWDRKSGEPELQMLKKEQILEMHQWGIEFGSHSMNHSDLTKIKPDTAFEELLQSKKNLERELGIETPTFAFPYGNCNEAVKKMGKDAGYKYLFATDRAPLGLHEDLYQIRRIGIFPNTTVRGLARKVKGNYPFKREKNNSSYLRISR